MLKEAITGALSKFKRHGMNKKAVRAAHGGDFSTAIQLVKDGADPNFSMPYELSLPIDTLTIMGNVGRAAVMRNSTGALQELLDLGLNKDLKLGRNQQSLLYIAIEERSEDAALLLLSRGADPGERHGIHSAYVLARDFNLTRVLQALNNSQGAAAAPAPPAVPATPVVAAFADTPVEITADHLKIKAALLAPERAKFNKKNHPT